MTNEHEDNSSIWASRNSPESVGYPSLAPRRARAGTLPSRLPSRIDTTREAPTSHLGSLALISPDGNDIVNDNFPPCSGSAVGQQPSNIDSNGFSTTEKRRSPPLAPIPEPIGVKSVGSSLNYPSMNNPILTNNSSLSNPSLSTPAMNNGTNLSPQILHPSSIPSSSTLAPPHNMGRARSGSLNSLAMRAQSPYIPFRSSIWGPSGSPSMNTGSAMPSSSVGSNSMSSNSVGSTSVGSNHIGSTSAASIPSSTSSSGGTDMLDPMSIFTNEVNKSNSHRLRSCTFDGGSDWGVPGLPLSQRTRAQTLVPQLNRFAVSDRNINTHSSEAFGDISSAPTPVICISNVPPQASQLTLHNLFSQFGKIESVHIVPVQRCVYIVFNSTIQAIEAHATANGAELFLGNGPSTVSFARLQNSSTAVGGGMNGNINGGINSIGSHHYASIDDKIKSANNSNGAALHMDLNACPNMPTSIANTAAVPTITNNSASTAVSGVSTSSPSAGPISIGMNSTPRHISPEARSQASSHRSAVALPETQSPAPVSVAYILQTLNADPVEINSGIEHLQRASSLKFDVPIKPLADSLAEDPGNTDRTYNAAVLRDLRRRLETMPSKEIEEVALDMQQELPVLASDYIGNTAVQLVFERCTQEMRDMMLRRLLNVFAATGTHKNGTWAVQKMIDLARGPRHYALIEQAIRPHLVSLLLDQFGNYVVQGCLKFGTPYNDFVYSGIASALASVAPNRFGARAVRAVLESEHTTAANQRLVATAIVQQIANLATNPNGCLLVSWLLDNFEKSDPDMHLRTHTLVAAQLVPQHLAAMCSSKLGSAIVLKLAASPSSSSHRVFDALVEPLTDRLPSILVEVLEDSSGQGASCIYRLMTTVFPVQSLERQVTVNKLRMCLLRPGARTPNHKRLLEEVGLSMLHPEAKESDSASPPNEVPVIHADS